MSPSAVVDDESVVCVTPTEGSVKGDDLFGDNPDDVVEVDEATSEEEKVMIGMVCDTKNLFQKWDRHDRYTWTEEFPDDLEEAAENEQTMKYAMLVRNKKSYDSRKKLEIDSIVIQSPLLKKVLDEVLNGYPGVTINLKRLVFAAPFKPFVHRWSEFTKALNSDEHDAETKTHVKLLYDVLEHELKDVISAFSDYTKNEVITYEHIWTILPPGATVFAEQFGRPIALKLQQGNYGEHSRYGQCFVIKADRVDWDGTRFGFDTVQQVILPFAGTRPITDLEVYPIEFHPDHEAVKAQLLERGRKFHKLAGYHYKSYKGPAVERQQIGATLVSVDSRIVVDAFAHGKFSNESQRSLNSLDRMDALPAVQGDADDDGGYVDNSITNYYGDDDLEDGAAERENKRELTDEQLILCSPMLKGFSLKTKKWLEFFVDVVDEVTFNERAFKQLVLPDGHKSMILAFAESQVKNKNRFDDDIAGKGKGMIMLLSGSPGTGKTLTAEAVAEAMHVPLYVMSAGDLGVSSYDIEDKLNRVLEMAAKWNAVLLLDECDIFLEARTDTDLNRNRVVNIFLRTLEYYEGILFLTTNRVKNMDEAFHSRIHISLEYPALDRPARKQIWQGALARRNGDDDMGHELTEAHVDRLSKLNINGRAIKNVLKTGNLLAAHQGKKLTFEHLKVVLKVEGHSIE
ncbi:P-loop containing nucleoside triphosphate hydrolase protein [Thozetella sp. PMI_491]|nr:P-loop containing nucleoside triphosphate hydrolase protein [Thozetella sp. PMI_491]